MKRFIKLLLIICLSLFGLTLRAANNSVNLPLDHGLIIRTGLGYVNADYGFANGLLTPKDYNNKPRVSFGFEVGYEFYVWRKDDESLGFAINVNALDLQFLTSHPEDPLEALLFGENKYSVFNVGFSEVGPMFTYAPWKDLALDVYINFRPTYISSSYLYSDGYYGERHYMGEGFGITYAGGINLRWKTLLLGVEYNFGNVNVRYYDYYEQSNQQAVKNYHDKVNASMVKILLGVKI